MPNKFFSLHWTKFFDPLNKNVWFYFDSHIGLLFFVHLCSLLHCFFSWKINVLWIFAHGTEFLQVLIEIGEFMDSRSFTSCKWRAHPRWLQNVIKQYIGMRISEFRHCILATISLPSNVIPSIIKMEYGGRKISMRWSNILTDFSNRGKLI
jgi:hypothetical protein